MKKKDVIERISVSDLIPYAKNSRTHTAEQVAQIAGSIKEFGFTNPVLIDDDNGIIAGHGRVLAAQKLGSSDVPCIRLSHLSETQKRAYVIADNKLAMNAGWDDELLSLEIKDLKDLDFDISLTGFDEMEVSNLLKEVTEGKTDPDEAPEPPEEPVTKPGDLWLLGNHRLFCGNSCDPQHLQLLMDGKLANLWLTDPPYNIAYEGGTKKRKAIENDSMAANDFRQFLRDAYSLADTYLCPGASFYIWHADSEGYNFRGAALDVGWQIRQTLIWNKNNSAFGRSDFHWKHEPCLYGWKEGAAHSWYNDRKQTTVLDFDRPSRSEQHPTMKPVDLMEYCLCNNTQPNSIVLDSFGGSGTTLMACELQNRHARLMELDPAYCDVIVKRWEDFTGKKAVLDKGSST